MRVTLVPLVAAVTLTLSGVVSIAYSNSINAFVYGTNILVATSSVITDADGISNELVGNMSAKGAIAVEKSWGGISDGHRHVFWFYQIDSNGDIAVPYLDFATAYDFLNARAAGVNNYRYILNDYLGFAFVPDSGRSSERIHDPEYGFGPSYLPGRFSYDYGAEAIIDSSNDRNTSATARNIINQTSEFYGYRINTPSSIYSNPYPNIAIPDPPFGGSAPATKIPDAGYVPGVVDINRSSHIDYGLKQ